jgi:hypothetical protein
MREVASVSSEFDDLTLDPMIRRRGTALACARGRV